MDERSDVETGAAGIAASPPPASDEVPRAATGVAGLDAVLGGGLPRNHAYLVQGHPGAGKTTLALQFCLDGIEQGERVLFISTVESETELQSIARSHDWSLDGLNIHYHAAHEEVADTPEQSVFIPAEVELPRTIEELLAVVERINPQRMVIDSLSEIRLIAENQRWYRRQMIALKDELTTNHRTMLLCDDLRTTDQPVESSVRGIIRLEQVAADYGPDRRRLRVLKLRGSPFATGYHDFKIRTGGLEVFPRLVAAEHREPVEAGTMSSGVAELDAMFGGGADRGASLLLLGPAGTGKSNVAAQFAAAAAKAGERAAMYIFDERVQTLLTRTASLGLGLHEQVQGGRVEIQQVDPAELTAGEFAHRVHHAVGGRGVRLIVIDSLTGYMSAMPSEKFLALHLHELLSFLSQQGVTTILIMAQHGLDGMNRRAPVDLSYVSDSVLLFHLFEHAGELRKAVSVYKRRGGGHENKIRELQFGPEGIHIGRPLREFEGILTGTPHYTGSSLSDVDDRTQVEG
ncbi:MAG: ATPase domain-containing protein [Planctomycetota bacterium]|nr:ATPase domain-containing protein [Planctomycetota bacterium]